ncbi:unnamed protein product [Rotaria sordida]|uniref:Uncharacterized protein n=1 Tax=Rotaria sordida TaxID=392033 RepID=A0A814JMV9_9BILA|nr:unnamed protein product [Rotaria sordida]CAF1040211.1 unnamed protein product [Rotaria sordida]
MKLDDDAEHNDKDEAVGVLRLFRFACGIDYVLMLISICLTVLQSCAILTSLVLYGRLSGLFAVESFSNNCDHQKRKSIGPIKDNKTYFSGIKLRVLNNILSNKLRDNNDVISLSNLAASMPSFREQVMNIIHWLFIIGTVLFVISSMEYFIWTITVKRQAFSMNISLFRSLVQRSISYMDTKSTSQLNAKLFDNIGKIEKGLGFEFLLILAVGNDASINEKEVWQDDTEAIYDINGDIEFENVAFTYPSRKGVTVLHNLSLVARVGQTTALVGSSGCGKSTCISLFLRYYEPSSGQIMINGRPITDYNIKQLRQNIGVVSQEPILFDMSIYENIRFGKVNATREEIEQAAREANAHHFIMQLPNKYETLVGERGIQLSGGEKQRVALARALVKQPSFLLLDEATSALDNVSEKIVQEALDQACKGRTTIVIAHRLTTIRKADQIYVLDNGSVIEQGTHETLMARDGGKYQAMVKRQQIESIDDDKDNMMSMQKAIEDDEKLLSMNSPEWITILIGCIACVLNGAAQPLFAFLVTKILNAFNYCSNSERNRQVLISSLIFLLLGVIVLILRFFQYTAFAIAGSKLMQRIRSKAFACLLRQEVAYFDRPENSSGAICTRLSSDASAIQEITGARLGIICEGIALSKRIGASVSAGKTFIDLFDRKSAIDNTSTEGKQLVDFRGEIKFDQVKFVYPTRPTSIILNKFLLNIKPSQRVALVGASGCGKSTAIQLLERFYDVTSGQILLDGIDIRQLNLHWVRSQFGLVSQEPVLFDLTIAENIAYGLENVSMEDIINAASRANIHRFIEQLPQGYETKVGMKGSFLSGGEKQRIAIARVLLRRPKVLLLDEATSAMDTHNEQVVQEALEQAQTEDLSRTSLMIAHRLSTIRSCDLICALDKGHIVESGTHTELTQRRGTYQKMLAQNSFQ